MANDRNSTDEPYSGPAGGPPGDSSEDRVRGGTGDDVRGVADEGDEEFEDEDDLEEDEDGETSL